MMKRYTGYIKLKSDTDKKTNIDKKSHRHGRTDLHKAIIKRNNIKAEKLLDKGADPLITDGYNLNAFHLAALYGNAAILERLLKSLQSSYKDDEIEEGTFKGSTLLSLALYDNYYAFEDGFVKPISTLLKCYSDNKVRVNVDAQLSGPILFQVILHSPPDELLGIKILIKNHVNLNEVYCGNTAIQYATRYGKVGIANYLEEVSPKVESIVPIAKPKALRTDADANIKTQGPTMEAEVANVAPHSSPKQTAMSDAQQPSDNNALSKLLEVQSKLLQEQMKTNALLETLISRLGATAENKYNAGKEEENGISHLPPNILPPNIFRK